MQHVGKRSPCSRIFFFLYILFDRFLKSTVHMKHQVYSTYLLTHSFIIQLQCFLYFLELERTATRYHGDLDYHHDIKITLKKGSESYALHNYRLDLSFKTTSPPSHLLQKENLSNETKGLLGKVGS